MTDLSHIDAQGRAQMVDIGEKDLTERTATAEGFVIMAPATRDRALSRETKKGDPIGIAELAGIMGAKRTSDLIPLCHPLPLTAINLTIEEATGLCGLRVSATAKTRGQTGVEMEALTAVSTACLTLYDMLKAIDKEMEITGISLLEKRGGKSGDYRKVSQ